MRQVLCPIAIIRMVEVGIKIPYNIYCFIKTLWWEHRYEFYRSNLQIYSRRKPCFNSELAREIEKSLYFGIGGSISCSNACRLLFSVTFSHRAGIAKSSFGQFVRRTYDDSFFDNGLFYYCQNAGLEIAIPWLVGLACSSINIDIIG